MTNATGTIEERYPRAFTRSMLYENGEARMRGFMREACEGLTNPRIAEIGTHVGVSASILCDYGHVDTFDIKVYSEFNRVTKVLCVAKGEITRHVCEPDDLHKLVVSMGPFDIGHIDGAHEYDDVCADFESLKTCKAILFHDYGTPHDQGGRAQPGVNRFINELDPACWVSMKPFAAVYPGRIPEHVGK